MICNVIALGDRVTGIDDILTVYSSIVCGLKLPIRQEHRQFLSHCLLPLHKLDRLVEYSSTLTRCLLLFISKDPSLCPFVRIIIRTNE